MSHELFRRSAADGDRPGERQRVTLADVAEAAGVSTSTASRALHGGAGVSEPLSERVRGAASALGYHVNVSARSLRRGRDQAIGLAVEDFTIPFFGRIVARVERGAHLRGHAVIITVAGSGRSEAESVEPLLSRGVAGIVVTSGTAGAPEGYLADVAERLPVVQVDAVGPSSFSDSIGIDNAAAGRRLTEHLLSYGHREILFLGSGTAASTVVLREKGYAEKMVEIGLVPRSEWLGYDPSQAFDAAVVALEAHPDVTAVVSGVARTTTGLLSALGTLDRRDVAVVAMDDIAGADGFDPPLTVVEQDVEAMGDRAVELLFERIDGAAGPPRHEEVGLRLIPRGSGERGPAHAPTTEGGPARTRHPPAGSPPGDDPATTPA